MKKGKVGLTDWAGLNRQLLDVLCGDNGEAWLTAIKNTLRKESDPWKDVSFMATPWNSLGPKFVKAIIADAQNKWVKHNDDWQPQTILMRSGAPLYRGSLDNLTSNISFVRTSLKDLLVRQHKTSRESLFKRFSDVGGEICTEEEFILLASYLLTTGGAIGEFFFVPVKVNERSSSTLVGRLIERCGIVNKLQVTEVYANRKLSLRTSLIPRDAHIILKRLPAVEVKPE